jgi:hypothetical protein
VFQRHRVPIKANTQAKTLGAAINVEAEPTCLLLRPAVVDVRHGQSVLVRSSLRSSEGCCRCRDHEWYNSLFSLKSSLSGFTSLPHPGYQLTLTRDCAR